MTAYDPAAVASRILRHFVEDHCDELTEAERLDLVHARRILDRHRRPTSPLG